MQWAEFEAMIQTVWESSLIKERVRSGFSEIVVPIYNAYDLPPSYAAAAAASVIPPARAAEPVDGRISKIDCDGCTKSFSASMRQIQKFEELRIPLPTRCPKCKGQICDKFKEDGECPYGDDCKFLHPIGADGEATIIPADVSKHSYSCRFFATGHCMSGDKCRFQHGPRKEPVHNISEVDPSVFNISEVDLSIQDEPLCVEKKIESTRFNYVTKVDASKYRYV